MLLSFHRRPDTIGSCIDPPFPRTRSQPMRATQLLQAVGNHKFSPQLLNSRLPSHAENAAHSLHIDGDVRLLDIQSQSDSIEKIGAKVLTNSFRPKYDASA